MSWIAIKLLVKKAWAWLKSIPHWLWAVLGWAAAFLALQMARRMKSQGEVQLERVQALTEKSKALLEVEVKRKGAIDQAEAAHALKKAEIEKTDLELTQKAGNADAVADAVNEAFGKSE